MPAPKSERVTTLHRVNLNADGVTPVLPENHNRVSLTVSVFHTDTANNHATYFGTTPELTRESGFPLRPSDQDLYIESTDALYAIPSNNRGYAVRIIEVSYV